MAKASKKSVKKPAKKAEKKAVKKEVPRKPRTPRLPGMEDSGIQELESLAEQYADVRDQRMVLTKREAEMNADLLALMKKHGKTEYHHDEVHCWIKAKDERVKVKLGEIDQQTSFKPEDEDDSSESGEELEAIAAEA